MSLLTKIIDYVIGFFSSREICRKPTGQNTAGSFSINFISHAIKCRQHSIERDVDLYVVTECFKKMQILYDRSKQIIIEICRLF